MPTFDKRARYPGGQQRIAIPTLSGGVGRQAPTKRAINEAENLDNVLVTLERSVEKRPPTNFIQRYDGPDFVDLDTTVTTSSLNLADNTANADYGFFWFQISEQQRYLIAINYASTSSSDDYFQIFRVTKDGFYECTIDGTDEADNWEYFTYGSNTAREALSSITVGPQMLINNSNVYAGYTSKIRTFGAGDTLDGVPTTSGDYWCKIGKDGEFIGAATNAYEEDTLGRKLVYYTSTPVDPEGQASIYVDGKFYIKNDQVFYSIPDGTDLKPWLQKRYDLNGNISFSDVIEDGSNNFLSAASLEEDLPLELIRFHLKEIKIRKDQHDPALTNDTLILTFHKEEGRTKFLELTKFFINNHDITIANAVSTDNGADEWYLTWTEVTTPVIATLANEADTASSSVPFTFSYTLRGVATDYTLPTSLTSYVDTVTDPAKITLDLSGESITSLVMIFTCIGEGTAEDAEWPAYDSDAGASAASFTLRSDDDGGPIAKFIPVEDWRYPDSTRRYLGNKLSDFSEFKFPPKSGDSNLDNDGSLGAANTSLDYTKFNQPPVDMDGKVGATLIALYDDIDPQGDGKIYYVENSYAGEVPGYYIVKDEDNSPYIRLIRTPYEYSVLDADRFPKILKIKTVANTATNTPEVFTIQNMDLEERRSGNINTNPGPEAFKDGLQRPIKSMAFFRDRLFLSAADTVFSSRTGDFSDFWVQNPGIVADTDPIDIRLSTNKYAEVESMTPFSSSMFINTGSDIQFTLQGSENNITPFTAEISPTAFYSTSPLVDPVLLGSQIYFFAPKRAYIFFNDATVSINQAIETSLTCPNYLPSNFGDIAVVPGYDSLCMIDDDNKKFVYVYTNRYRGAEVAQNAFFRYIFDTDMVSVNSYDNDVYYVSRTSSYDYFLEYQKFYEEDLSVPRIDHQITLSESDAAQYGSITYDSGTNRTTIVVKNYGAVNPDILYIDSNAQQEERGGEVIIVGAGLEDDVVISAGTTNGTLTIVLQGDFTTSGSYRKFRFGTSYNMSIELSPQYVRDGNQNVVEGVFSIRTLHLQHHNTGSYNVAKEVRGRRSTVLRYTPAELDESQVSDPDDLPMPLYEKNGETFSKIMGFAAETNIFIESDFPNPVNIAQIELKGRFTNRTSGFVR